MKIIPSQLIQFKPNKKQHETFQLLERPDIQSVLFGGGVGGGKSYLISAYLLISCFRYPGTRHALCRSRLSTLKRSTVKTIQDLILEWGLTQYVNFNNQTNTFTFDNKSEIVLLDLFPFPADTSFDRFGSLEVTSICIDELSEVTFTAFQVLSSRCRYKLNEYNLTPKILCASNPTRSWPHNYFIKNPTPDTKFVQCLAKDNKYLPKSYIQSLDKLETGLKERLLYGNWDFQDSDFELFKYEAITNCFYNEYFNNPDDKQYLTVDVGDVGSDQTYITHWKGWNATKIYTLKQTETSGVVDKVKQLIGEYRIPIQYVIVDSVGVGAGVASYLKGCVRFVGSSSPLLGEKYTNIKSQLMFKYAELVNDYRVNYNFPYDDKLIQDHLAYQKVIKEDKHGITPKDTVKQRLGRSPDSCDSMYLRAYWEFKNKSVGNFSVI